MKKIPICEKFNVRSSVVDIINKKCHENLDIDRQTQCIEPRKEKLKNHDRK